MKKYIYPSPTFSEVSKCAFTSEGEKILHKMGGKKRNLRPPPKWLPWATFSGVRNNIKIHEYIF